MDKVEIKHPRQHNTGAKSVPRQFVAAGTSSGNIVRVEGRLTGGGLDLVGHPVVWIRRGGRFHWQFVFRAENPGRYALDVTGYGHDGAVVHRDSVRAFEVMAPRAVETSYPSNNQDITDEADYFVAYGVPSVDVLEATMTPSGGSAQNAAYLTSDTTNNPPYWAAQFNPLGVGVYRLDVFDTQGSNDPRTGLTVDS